MAEQGYQQPYVMANNNDRQQPLMMPTTANTAATSSIPITPPRSSYSSSSNKKKSSLNDRLNTNYIDIPSDDVSFCANLTRSIVRCVGHFSTPRQILAGLRIVKAITFCFLVLTIAADITYVCFVEMLASSSVRAKVGGTRDTIIRCYGLAMAIVALMIELDVAFTTKFFLGLKGFIPRSLLLFLIATITGGHPLHDKSNYSTSSSSSSSSNYSYNSGYSSYTDNQVTNEIPSSAVVFQMVTSFVLGLCSFMYFGFGILCLDRFTAKAFVSNKDPVITTAIPQTPTQLAASAVATGNSNYHNFV